MLGPATLSAAGGCVGWNWHLLTLTADFGGAGVQHLLFYFGVCAVESVPTFSLTRTIRALLKQRCEGL